MSGSDPTVRRLGTADGMTAGTAGGGASPDGTDGCPGPDFRTSVGSPFPDVVDTIRVGDVLDLEYIDEGGVRAVRFVTLYGETLGSLTTDIRRIRACMAHGWVFEAEVVRKAGGSVVVEVRARDS